MKVHKNVRNKGHNASVGVVWGTVNTIHTHGGRRTPPAASQTICKRGKM